MSLKFGRIQPSTAKLAALDQFKKSFIREYSKYFDDFLSGERSLPFGLLVNWIFFILADNEDMHESLDEFEFWRDPTTDYGVSCPWPSEKSMYNVVNTLAPSFFIEYSLFLQVTRAIIKSGLSWMTIIKSGLSSKLSLIGSFTAELAALECLKNSP